MELYDVVIVGAGPAGLKCAETLGGTGLDVLLLEKNDVIGQKVCAGGLTALDLKFCLPLDKGKTVTHCIAALNGKIHIVYPDHPLHTIGRIDLGQHQLEAVQRYENIEIRRGTSVSEISETHVTTKEGTKISFRFLVGADGSTSLVRRHLGLESRLYMGMHYIVPDVYDEMVWFFQPELLGSGYGWIFPHPAFTSAGVYFNPALLPAKRAREGLHKLLDDYGLDYRSAVFSASPVNCLYRGVKFRNIFLAGDAAGLVSACTGEGIAYALTSGQDIARHLLDSAYRFDNIRKILTYKRRQEVILSVFDRFPAFQKYFFRIFIELIKRPGFQKFYIGDL